MSYFFITANNRKVKVKMQINYLIIVMCFLLVLVKSWDAPTWETQNFLKKEHSLIKPYQSSGIIIPHWDFIGSTMITNNYVRLTPDQQSKSGAIWNTVPCLLQNWELRIQFKVHGKGRDLFGDGIAIWYARDLMIPGPVFGSVDKFHGLAIFLDTYANQNGPHNHAHPYISAMVNNGTLHYDHDQDGTHTELSGCEVKFRGASHDTFVLIRYAGETLTVATEVEGKNTWNLCFTSENIQLPTEYHFGLSATTGDLSDNHDIISVKLYELEIEQKKTEDRSKISPAASYFAPPRDHIESSPQSMSGIKLFFIVVCALLGLCVCIVGGVIIIQQRQECTRKRLY